MLLCRKDFLQLLSIAVTTRILQWMFFQFFFFDFRIHLQLNLMRKAFKQLTTEACLKPLTLYVDIFLSLRNLKGLRLQYPT